MEEKGINNKLLELEDFQTEVFLVLHADHNVYMSF